MTKEIKMIKLIKALIAKEFELNSNESQLERYYRHIQDHNSIPNGNYVRQCKRKIINSKCNINQLTQRLDNLEKS